MNAQPGAWRMFCVTMAAPIALNNRLGGFGFQSPFYADDGLLVGSTDPVQLFHTCTMWSEALPSTLRFAFTFHQCHNIEPKMPGQFRSVMNMQKATAKALFFDGDALRNPQRSGDVLGASGALMPACNTGVRPALAEIREEMDVDPLGAYRRSGHERIASGCVGEVQAGWGA